MSESKNTDTGKKPVSGEPQRAPEAAVSFDLQSMANIPTVDSPVVASPIDLPSPRLPDPLYPNQSDDEPEPPEPRTDQTRVLRKTPVPPHVLWPDRVDAAATTQTQHTVPSKSADERIGNTQRTTKRHFSETAWFKAVSDEQSLAAREGVALDYGTQDRMTDYYSPDAPLSEEDRLSYSLSEELQNPRENAALSSQDK